MGDAPSVLQVEGVCVRYGGVVAVDNVSLVVRPGQIVGLIGPNGAGKTSFIDAVSGFTACAGTVRLGDTNLEGLAPHVRSRAGLARTWQSLELFGDLSVEDNVLVASERVTLGSLLADGTAVRRRSNRSDTVDLLSLVNLQGVSNKYPRDLSLGQQKLLGVARALARNPKIVLLDEPAAGLDSSESLSLGAQLRTIVGSGLGALLVDHDMGLVMEVCDYVYVMDFGTVIAEGSPSEIRRDPRVIEAYLGESGDEAISVKEPSISISSSPVEP